jgi:hypothetical protein
VIVTTWRPILDGTQAERARAAVMGIIDELRPTPSLEHDDAFTLMGGEPGPILLFAYAAHAFGDESLASLARARLAMLTEQVMERTRNLFLFTGLTGVVWTIEQVSKLLDGPGGADEEDPHDAIDEMVLEYLERAQPEVPFELIKGIAGLGIYALERWPRPGARGVLEQVVRLLAACAEKVDDGVAWLRRPETMDSGERAAFPNGYYSLSAAHGVPGPIAILAAARARGVSVDTARPLLDGALAWLWRQRLPDVAAGHFPDLAGERSPSRATWCYGDPTIASVLLSVGDEWAHRAVEVMRDVATRSVAACRLESSILCHGTAGLAHILNRFGQRAGDEDIRRASLSWYARALDDPRGEAGASNFLDGSAGVGLALLAACTGVPPAWDRVLMLSD